MERMRTKDSQEEQGRHFEEFDAEADKIPREGVLPDQDPPGGNQEKRQSCQKNECSGKPQEKKKNDTRRDRRKDEGFLLDLDSRDERAPESDRKRYIRSHSPGQEKKKR